jgi:hypothetical protein
MVGKYFGAMILPLLAVCQIAMADADPEELAAVTKDVKVVCTQPQTQGVQDGG